MNSDYSYLFLETTDLYLRPFLDEDKSFFANCENRPEIREKIGVTRPTTPQALERRIHTERDDAIWLAIVRKRDNQIIGETGLLRIFPDWSCSDLSIMIYDTDDRHHGLGTQAINALMHYAFGDLHLHRLSIGVVGFNEAA